jgi:hypothetical protein
MTMALQQRGGAVTVRDVTFHQVSATQHALTNTDPEIFSVTGAHALLLA